MKATKVNSGLAESNGKLLLGIWRDSLHVTCGLTACTPGSAPGSAPGPTLGNEYGKTLPFLRRANKNCIAHISGGISVSSFKVQLSIFKSDLAVLHFLTVLMTCVCSAVLLGQQMLDEVCS